VEVGEASLAERCAEVIGGLTAHDNGRGRPGGVIGERVPGFSAQRECWLPSGISIVSLESGH